MTNTERTQTVDQTLRALDRIKAPTKRAAHIAATLTELPTQAEVEDFTAELRRRAGVQDVALLPDTTWTLIRFLGPYVEADGGTVTTPELVELIGHSAHIDWPSVTFHWGVAVRWTTEPAGEGVRWIARSADYALTETYLSS